ncbi:MAG: ATP-binding protein [bacterium]
MKELVVISGKGGTGKTIITASFAALAKNKVMADCDVDAADLHLLLQPQVKETHQFRSGKIAKLDMRACNKCGKCIVVCRFDAISPGFKVNSISCEGCGVCSHICEQKAIKMEENLSGDWFISETQYGPMAHAKLGIAEENSGKLVTLVRNQAKLLAEKHKYNLIIIDGPPGIGCPVIAAITGASAVLVVTEPTLSGLHDLDRVAKLAGHFGIPTLVCINKYDLNTEMAERITQYCQQNGYSLVGKIRFDPLVVESLVNKKPVVEYSHAEVSVTIKKIWEQCYGELKMEGN